MHPDLEKLIVLQGLDLEAKRLKDAMAAVPKRIADLAGNVAAAKAQLAGTTEKLAAEDLLRRKQELEVKELEAKRARLKRQMDAVTTTAQAAALEHEISFVESEITRLEDAELASMEQSEDLEARKKNAEETLVHTEATHARESARSEEELVRDRGLLAEIEARRVELRPEIGEATLSMYDRIAKAKGTGLAEGVDHKCSACQMMVRPQKWNDLRDRSNDETIMTCESCGRILYWDPARDAPQKKPAQTESIAASIVRASI